jgi:hypothetical protein
VFRLRFPSDNPAFASTALDMASRLSSHPEATPEAQDMARRIFIEWRARPLALEKVVKAVKTDRNAPCPCGSGRKFKVCHGAPPPVDDLAAFDSLREKPSPHREGN